MIASRGVQLGAAEGLTTGADGLAGALAPFTAESVAELCGIDADTTRRIAAELSGGQPAAVYSRIGTHTVSFGTLAAWAVDVLNLVTGNLDRPGGIMWSSPCHGRPAVEGDQPGGRGFRIGRWTSRAKGYPEVRGEMPVATLPDEMETPGEGQVRALITIAGNPAVSNPDSARVERALAGLDFMVSVDIYLNETTRHADVVLPPPSSLQKAHFDLAFYGLSVRNVANWSPAVLPAEGPDECEIFAKLALIASGMGADADPEMVYGLVTGQIVQQAVGLEGGPLHGRDPEDLLAAVEHRPMPDRAVDLLVRCGLYGDHFGVHPDGLTLDLLEANPHGIDLGPLVPRLREVLKTQSGTVEVLPEPVVGDLPRLVAELDRSPATELLLVGRRHVRSNNSWMHNVRVLVKGKERCTLLMHPDDAASRGLTDGSTATVSSRVGSLTAPVELTDNIRPGVVSLPHGWGHGVPGTRLEVAAEFAGVNSNVLTDGSVIDPLSGNSALNAIPVEVAPA